LKKTQRAGAQRSVRIELGDGAVEASLQVPHDARGLIVLVPRRGARGHGARERRVLRCFDDARFATLRLRACDDDEQVIELPTSLPPSDFGRRVAQLVRVSPWLAEQYETRELRIGYFATGIEAAVALAAAARLAARVSAVVCYGGRADLAGAALSRVQAPTLQIVGGADLRALALHEAAYARLRCVKRLVVLAGASRQFQQPRDFNEVLRLARHCFEQHLA
jgi:putative phosphoribosyl transferase